LRPEPRPCHYASANADHATGQLKGYIVQYFLVIAKLVPIYNTFIFKSIIIFHHSDMGYL
jgi:hypothetical protein